MRKAAAFSLVAVALVYLVFAQSWKQADVIQNIQPQYQGMPEHEEMAMRAWRTFTSSCQSLFMNNSQDIESARLEFQPLIDGLTYSNFTWYTDNENFLDTCLFYQCESYDWMAMAAITVKIKDTAQSPSALMAQGHNLFYFMGGGLDPGIIHQKEQSASMCGWQDVSEGTLVDVPGMQFLPGVQDIQIR